MTNRESDEIVSYIRDRQPKKEQRKLDSEYAVNTSLVARTVRTADVSVQMGAKSILIQNQANRNVDNLAAVRLTNDWREQIWVLPTEIEQSEFERYFEDKVEIGAGAHAYEYSASNGLRQSVRFLLTSDRLPIEIPQIEVCRQVNSKNGDLSYGFVTLLASETTERMGYHLKDTEALTVAVAENNMWEVEGFKIARPITTQQLEKARLRLRFVDVPDRSVIAIGWDDWTYRVRMGKKLLPNYFERMFDQKPTWITDSAVSVEPIETLGYGLSKIGLN